MFPKLFTSFLLVQDFLNFVCRQRFTLQIEENLQNVSEKSNIVINLLQSHNFIIYLLRISHESLFKSSMS